MKPLLFYLKEYQVVTKNLNASQRGWYIDLVMYKVMNGIIPNDLDTITGICRVQPAEYDLFNKSINNILKKFN